MTQFLALLLFISDCDVQYSQRPASLPNSIDCYAAVAASAEPGDPSLRYEALSKLVLAQSWVAIKDADKPTRVAMIDRGKAASELLVQEFPASAEGFYWRSVFVAREAWERDQGTIIPRETLRALPSIKRDLNKALQLDRSVHGYGPERTLGLINIQTPAAVGGNARLGEELLRKSWQADPRFSINPLELGRFLVNQRRWAEARSVLEPLITLSSEEFHAARAPENAEDRLEALKLWNDIP